MAKKELTNKQKAFCREYVIDHNGTQAAIRAGYSKNGAEVSAVRVLRNDRAKEYITRLEREMRVDTEWSVEKAKALLMETRERAIAQGTSSVEVSAVVAINRMYGLDKDASLDKQEAEAITPEELELLKKQAEAITKPNIKLNAG